MDTRKHHRPHGTAGVDADRTDWFLDGRFGLGIHWGLYAIPARGAEVRSRERMTDAGYRTYLEEFAPTRYAPRQWAEQARRAGMRYAVMAAKHHDGFCLFHSQHTDFGVRHTPIARDLLLEYVDAFREAGLKIGFSYSLPDWQHPDHPIDDRHPLRDDPAARSAPRDLSRYVTHVHEQVRELMSNYGRIDLLRFDGGAEAFPDETWRAGELADMVRGLQPHIVLSNGPTAARGPDGAARRGDQVSITEAIPSGTRADAGEGNVRESVLAVDGSWGYHRDVPARTSAAEVVRLLVDCVSRSGNLLLDIGPTALGEFPPGAGAMLAEVAHWMERHAPSVHGCDAVALPRPAWGCCTRRGHVLYAHVFEPPADGVVTLPGLGGRVRRARLLGDGSEIALGLPGGGVGDGGDLHLRLPETAPGGLLDPVIALELVPGDPLAG